MEDLYEFKSPKDFILKFCEQLDSTQPCNFGWTGIHNVHQRYVTDFPKAKEVIFALAVLRTSDNSDFRKFPVKHWTKEEWGSNPIEIRTNAFKLGEILEKYFTTITHIQLNEHWFDHDLYEDIMIGLSDALDRIKLIETATQSTDPAIGGMLYYNWHEAFENTNIKSIHPYPWTEQGSQDLSDKPENLYYRYISDFKETYPDNPKYITEIGWNSHQTGEDYQCAYLIRGLLLAMIQGYQKYYIYELIDQPDDALFKSTGLLRSDLTTKPSYTHLMFLLEKYGDYYYLGHTQIGKNWSVCLTNGIEQLFVEWNEDSPVFEYVKKLQESQEPTEDKLQIPATITIDRKYIEDYLNSRS